MIFEMKSEAKVAFKASALYFLVMTLAIIYTQNHVLIHANYQKMNMNVWGKIKAGISMAPRYFLLVVRKYRRRHYNHVYDVGPGGPGTSGAGGPGLGLAKVNINSRGRSKNNRSKQEEDYDSGLEDLGLGMRERSEDGGGTGGGFASSLLKTIMSKSKKR